jgi:hypothetical protein
VGCPIRRSRDQRLLASPPGFSQRATSFIASQCQGIHQMPFLRSIPGVTSATPGKTRHSQGQKPHAACPQTDDGRQISSCVTLLVKTLYPRGRRTALSCQPPAVSSEPRHPPRSHSLHPVNEHAGNAGALQANCASTIALRGQPGSGTIPSRGNCVTAVGAP